MAKEAKILFEFENTGNKVIRNRPINYSDNHSDKYFNISMIQEIIDGVITNEVDTSHLGCTSIKTTELIWQRDVLPYYNVYKHLKIYGDNSNFKIKYSLNDTNVIELPISNNKEFYMYLSDDHATLSVKCQDLWYEITVTDQNTLTYTTSENSDFNLLPSPEKNNIVYKDDLDRYTYSKIEVGDNLKGKRIGLCNDESTVNTFLHNITKDNYLHNIITGEDVSIGYENKAENSYIDFKIKYASASSYHFMNEISLYDSGYRPFEEYYTCTEDFIVTSISAGWDDILMVIDEVPLLSTKEDKSNKVSSMLSSFPDDQYPTVRAVVDYVDEKVVPESYFVYDKETDALPNITVTAGDFVWNATTKTLTVKGASNTTKTATIKFNEDVDGVYYAMANSSSRTGRMGMLSAKINNEDYNEDYYYIGELQGFGIQYSQWDMKKNDIVTIEYTGDSTATDADEFVFTIVHWEKLKETTSAASYANYVVEKSELYDQRHESSLRTDVLNMKYDMDEYHTHYYQDCRKNVLPICTITNGTNGFNHPNKSVDFTATSADGMTYETTLTITQENMIAMGFLATITSSEESAIWGECTLKIENTTQNRVLLETSEIGESRTIEGVDTEDSIKMTFTCPENVYTPMEVTVSAVMYLTSETTSKVEDVIYSATAIEEFITDRKIGYLKNELKHIKAQQAIILNGESGKETEEIVP